MKQQISNILTGAGVAGGYVLAAGFGLRVGTGHQFDAPGWLSTGLALAAVLLLGYRVWPGLLVGAFAAGALTLWRAEMGLWGVMAGAASLGLANTAQAVVGAWLVRRFADGRNALSRPQTTLKFVMLVAVASLFGAVGAAVAAGITGLYQDQGLGSVWFTSWLGAVFGTLVVAPLILAWTTPPRTGMTRKRLAEAAALFVLVALLCMVLFGQVFHVRTRPAPVAFLMIPVLLWSALRFGQRGSTSITFIVACMATAATLQGRGPFALREVHASFLLLEDYIAVITVMSLILTADVRRREAVEGELRASEQRYRDVFDYHPQPMWLCDYETLRLLAVNRAAEQEYGYTRAEFLDMRLPDLWPEQDRPAMLEMVRQARRGLEMRADCRQVRKGGAVRDVSVTSRNLIFDGREAAVIMGEDITERKRAEKQTAAFSELARRLSAASSASEAARIVMTIADGLIGWDACVFELCLEGRTELTTVLAVDTLDGRRSDVTLESSQSVPGAHTQRTLKEGARLILRPEPAVFAPDMNPFGDKRRPSASLMFAPVRADDEPIAVLSLQSYRYHAYTESDLRLFQALADHCGSALKRIRAEAALRESVERLRLALSAGQMGTWTAELKGRRQLRISPELEEIFGLGPDEFTSSWVGLLELVHPEDRRVVRKAARNALRKEADFHLEFRFMSRGRPGGWLFARGRAYGGAPGHPVRIAGVAMDITARKTAEQEILRLNAQLENRVGERTAQLEAINKELEAFSYSVSHDLRAPLRSIRGFSDLLLEQYGKRLDAQGKDFLRRMCDSSQHMDRLIEDLLKLSRVGRSELQHQEIDLSALASGIVRELRQADPDSHVTVAIGPGLRAQGDERLLRIVLENLLRNAWKFTGKKARPRVEFGFAASPQHAFYVRDNGAGFDMAYASKLFGVFQRLHSVSEFPGTGVGLATVQRIINRHGGRVWAEAVPEQGAVFYFTLPGKRVVAQALPAQLA